VERHFDGAIFPWMDAAELRQQADRCRRLATAVDDLSRDRLLALAEHYQQRAEEADAERPRRDA
jgi:hypothetical protein